MKNNVEALKDNLAIKLIVEEIQDLNKQIEGKQKDINMLIAENEKITKNKEQEKIQAHITKLEQEIEDRMETLKKLRSE